MHDEFDALLQNNIWTLVPKPSGANVVSGKWVFHHKYNSDGTLPRYKERWVSRGFSQQHGIDFDETFPLLLNQVQFVVCLVSLFLHHGQSINWTLKMSFFMVLSTRHSIVNNLLGLKILLLLIMFFFFTNPYTALNMLLMLGSIALLHLFNLSVSFPPNLTHPFFIFRSSAHTAYLLLYIDDIILTVSSDSFLQHIISSLSHEFSVSDLGHFPHVTASRTSTTLFFLNDNIIFIYYLVQV
jgi:hypothetical protein